MVVFFLEEIARFKDLVGLIKYDLQFNRYIVGIVNGSYCTFGFIGHTCIYKLCSCTSLYKSLDRSNIEFKEFLYCHFICFQFTE